jgi:hypothetical protein
MNYSSCFIGTQSDNSAANTVLSDGSLIDVARTSLTTSVISHHVLDTGCALMCIQPGLKSRAAKMSELTAIDALRSPIPRRSAIRHGAAVKTPAARNGSSLRCGGHIARRSFGCVLLRRAPETCV